MKETLAKIPIPKVTPSRIPPNKASNFHFITVNSKIPTSIDPKPTPVKKEVAKKETKTEEKKQEEKNKQIPESDKKKGPASKDKEKPVGSQ